MHGREAAVWYGSKWGHRFQENDFFIVQFKRNASIIPTPMIREYLGVTFKGGLVNAASVACEIWMRTVSLELSNRLARFTVSPCIVDKSLLSDKPCDSRPRIQLDPHLKGYVCAEIFRHCFDQRSRKFQCSQPANLPSARTRGSHRPGFRPSILRRKWGLYLVHRNGVIYFRPRWSENLDVSVLRNSYMFPYLSKLSSKR